MIMDKLHSTASNLGLSMAGGSSVPPLSSFAFMSKPKKELPGFETKNSGLAAAENKIYEMLSQVRTQQAQRLPTMLASHIRNLFEAAKTAKMTSGVTESIDQCLRAKKGEYDPEILSQIRSATPGGSEAYMMITNVKCRACEALLKNAMLPTGDERPYGIDPTPVPELPEALEIEIEEQVRSETLYTISAADSISAVTEDQVQSRLDEFRKRTQAENFRKAKIQAEILEGFLDDELVEGNFYKALAEFLNDIATYPTAFLKGPVVRRSPALEWVQDPSTGDFSVKATMKLKREYERVSPYDIFPSPGARNIQDGYVCERQRLRLSDLQSMIGVQGYSDDCIRAALAEYGSKGYKEILPGDYQRAEAEGRPGEYLDPESRIDAIEFWGSVQGRALIDWGMDEATIPDPTMAYQITALLVGQFVVMARLNPHPLGHNPYYASSFSYNNDSLWGESPPMIMRDDQKACNSTARALFNRMAFASGPIIEVHMDRMMGGEDPGNLRPWMILKTKSDINSPHQAVYLTEMNPYADIFLTVYEFFFKQASEKTGIPNYVHGTNTDKAGGGTASGMAMMINNMNAMMRNVIMGIDNEVIKPVVKSHWLHMMLYDEDKPKIGDINIRARATDYIIAQEQLQLRRNEALQTTNNPTDIEIIGKRGRAKMLRENFRSLHYDDDIIPSDDEMAMEDDKIAQYEALVADLTAKVDQLTAAGATAQGAPPGGAGQAMAPPQANVTPESVGAAMAPDGSKQGLPIGRLMS